MHFPSEVLKCGRSGDKALLNKGLELLCSALLGRVNDLLVTMQFDGLLLIATPANCGGTTAVPAITWGTPEPLETFRFTPVVPLEPALLEFPTVGL